MECDRGVWPCGSRAARKAAVACTRAKHTPGFVPELTLRSEAEEAKTMPRWAGGEDKTEVEAGRRCRWPSRTRARGERVAGSGQPEEAAGDETSLTMRGQGL